MYVYIYIIYIYMYIYIYIYTYNIYIYMYTLHCYIILACGRRNRNIYLNTHVPTYTYVAYHLCTCSRACFVLQHIWFLITRQAGRQAGRQADREREREIERQRERESLHFLSPGTCSSTFSIHRRHKETDQHAWISTHIRGDAFIVRVRIDAICPGSYTKATS